MHGTPAGFANQSDNTRVCAETCLSRGPTCDETRPICERCRKGNRECVYPDPPAPKGASGLAGKSTASHASPISSNEDDEDADKEVSLEPIPDADEPDDASQQHSTSHHLSPIKAVAPGKAQALSGRHGSETPSQEDNKSSSPSSSTVTSGSFSATTHQISEFLPAHGAPPDWSHLPYEYQNHLEWFSNHMTHYHYSMVQDKDDFFTVLLPTIALRNEPLLNAIVGFAAYHRTLQNPNGKMEDFLQYYNKSVTLLLGFLKRKEKHNIATLLTILQLATIEEYLGDWVNLMGHQKAAYEILTTMFGPHTVMKSAVGRACFMWYYRFDNFVALMGGFPTELPREWYDGMISFTHSQVAASPDSVEWKIEFLKAHMRKITYDMSIVFARRSRGQLTSEEFDQEHDKLTRRLEQWMDLVDPALTDPQYLVNDFPAGRVAEPDAVFNPYQPGVLYGFPLFNTNILMIEWLSVVIMHKSQLPADKLRASLPELGAHASKIGQLFELIEHWESTPSGVLLAIQPALSLGALFLPQGPEYHMWLRKKFARLEAEGYIYPSTIRKKMAFFFRDPSCEHWWLPDDDSFTPVLQSIRNFAEERNAAAVTAQQESLREIRHIFAKLEL
ncbi:hypothetical protein HJFPF1_00644 [Paramyrothecium foliicola]|nr:hypothetical protein HJFPF1_00644 [Paramyrothecium foliicola]